MSQISLHVPGLSHGAESGPCATSTSPALIDQGCVPTPSALSLRIRAPHCLLWSHAIFLGLLLQAQALHWLPYCQNFRPMGTPASHMVWLDRSGVEHPCSGGLLNSLRFLDTLALILQYTRVDFHAQP